MLASGKISEAAFDQLAFEESQRPASQQEDALRRCLEELPDKARALVQFRYHESLKVDDIASRIAGSPEAIQKALSRLRDRLQKCVERRLRAA